MAIPTQVLAGPALALWLTGWVAAPSGAPARLPAEFSVTPSAAEVTAATIRFDGEGIRFDTDGAVTRLVTEQEVPTGTQVVIGSDVLFAFDSDQVDQAGADLVAGLVADAARGARVQVVGHTDAIADEAYNLDLSRRRADAVAALVTAARPDLTVTAEGRGEAEPVAPNETDGQDDPRGRAQNRRVELAITAAG